MATILTKKQKEILRKILYAVESGGQVYGKQNYSAFDGVGANCSNEKAITIGAGQWYAGEAKILLNLIHTTYPATFSKLDTANIAKDLEKSWAKYDVTAASKKGKAIISIISSKDGIKCQDTLMENQITVYATNIQKLYGTMSVDAVAEAINIYHQGGASALKRILAKTKKPYSAKNIKAALDTDKQDKSSNNQVGDYTTRQNKVYNMIVTYLMPTITDTGGKNTTSNVKLLSPDSVIAIAKKELGYLEKKSNSNLDSKTANAGSNNYTKYWRDMANLGLGNYQAQYWCACFVHWCFYKAFGLTTSQKLLLQKFFISCATMANLAKKAGCLYSSPKVGDVILFYKSSSGYYHTGIVIKVTSDSIKTIEGNTSGGSSVIRNGGGVVEKTYKLSSLNAKFMRPVYDSASTTSSTSSSTSSASDASSVLKKGDVGNNVKAMQKMLIACGYSCGSAGADGDFGTGTVSALKKFQKASSLTVDGIYGSKSKAALKKLFKIKSTTTSHSLNKISKWTGTVTATSLNVRMKAGKENITTSFSPLKKGAKVGVCDTQKAKDGSIWYYIKYKKKYGFVSSSYIKK